MEHGLGTWTWTEWVSLLSLIAYGTLAVAAARNQSRSPLSPPFGRTTAALFAYEAFELLKHTTGEPVFLHLECAAASLVVPTTAAFVITFLGSWRSLRWLVIAGASYFSLLSLLCLGATVVPALASFSANPPWALAMLAGMFPEFAYLGWRLFHHAQRSPPTERARTQLLVLALLLGAGGAGSDLAAIAGLAMPRIAVFSLLIAALVFGALALRMDIVSSARRLVILNVVAVILLAILFHAMTLTLSERPTLTATLAVSITLAAVATLRPILAVQAEERARLQQLATLGRFSAQMAHDLKNPLAAIRGAAQFLLEERSRGASLDPHEHFVSLILEQTDRATRVVDDYQRLGRTEAVRRPVELAPLLSELASAQRAASAAHPITVEHASPSSAELDRDLILGALENLVRNAREAMPEGGAIILGARETAGALELFVSDQGPGMDARLKERIFDDFFTTKASGSGLGLAFVARVASAHGGRATVESELGRGTTIRLSIPSVSS